MIMFAQKVQKLSATQLGFGENRAEYERKLQMKHSRTNYIPIRKSTNTIHIWSNQKHLFGTFLSVDCIAILLKKWDFSADPPTPKVKHVLLFFNISMCIPHICRLSPLAYFCLNFFHTKSRQSVHSINHLYIKIFICPG